MSNFQKKSVVKNVTLDWSHSKYIVLGNCNIVQDIIFMCSAFNSKSGKLF